MRSALVLLLVAAINFTIGCSQQPGPVGGQPKPSGDVVASTMGQSKSPLQLEKTERRPVGVVSPQQLYDEYTRNQVAAEANYDGQFIKVVGLLIGLQRDDLA